MVLSFYHFKTTLQSQNKQNKFLPVNQQTKNSMDKELYYCDKDMKICPKTKIFGEITLTLQDKKPMNLVFFAGISVSKKLDAFFAFLR